MRLLLATKNDNGLYKSVLLDKFVTFHFYRYQVSGAVGISLKLYGQIDAEALLLATDCLQHPQADMVREAATQQKDICLNGAIHADETGFGKTKQSLLAAVLHSILYTDEDKRGKECHRPVLLVVPPTLITQWVVEIQDYWPFFRPVLSYDDPTFRMATYLSIIPAGAMRGFPDVELLPECLRYIFDKRNKRARQAMVVTSYATHRHRTGRVEESETPGQYHDPPQYDPISNRQIYKVRPHVQTVWTTSFRGRFSLLIADEAQKVKNHDTDTWAVLKVHEFPKLVLITATPMFNAAQVSPDFNRE
jgi:SNF2 family DNA or RNA helicase